MSRLIRVLLSFYVILELVVIYYLSQKFGFFPIFVEILLSAFMGVVILINLRFSFQQTFLDLFQGKLGFRDFVMGNFSKIFGALILILPGIICDIAAVVLFIISYFLLKKKPPLNQKDINTNHPQDSFSKDFVSQDLYVLDKDIVCDSKSHDSTKSSDKELENK